MTSRSDDELVSSVLDGEAPDEARSIVAADPVLRDRLATFGAIQRDVQAVEFDEEVADRIRLAALMAVETEHRDDHDAPAAPVHPLAAHRTRARARRRASGALVAAAVVVIGLLGFSASRPDGDDASLATAGSAASSNAAAPEMLRAGVAGDAATAAATPARDLGAATDISALAAAWRAGQGAAGTATKAAPGAAASAATAGAAGPVPLPAAGPQSDRCGPPVGYATLAGRPVVLIAGTTGIRVLDAANCSEVGRFAP